MDKDLRQEIRRVAEFVLMYKDAWSVELNSFGFFRKRCYSRLYKETRYKVKDANIALTYLEIAATASYKEDLQDIEIAEFLDRAIMAIEFKPCIVEKYFLRKGR